MISMHRKRFILRANHAHMLKGRSFSQLNLTNRTAVSITLRTRRDLIKKQKTKTLTTNQINLLISFL